jgi:hypothetical protein
MLFYFINNNRGYFNFIFKNNNFIIIGLKTKY